MVQCRTVVKQLVSSRFKFIALVFFVFLLSACENLQDQQAGSPETAATANALDETANTVAESAAVEETVVNEEIVEQPVWQFDVGQLLYEADSALAADRLTTPIEDNAFDRYHAVLLIEPGNKLAENGLEEIFQRYVRMTEEAIRVGEYGKARALVERARSVNSQSEVVDLLVKDLNQRQRQRARTQPQIVIEPNQKEIPLDVDGLNSRDESMVEQLQGLAVQVQEADETLLIVARSDSEGRWIYQKMADGVPGYRLRGDIRLGREPKLLLLPPIE